MRYNHIWIIGLFIIPYVLASYQSPVLDRGFENGNMETFWTTNAWYAGQYFPYSGAYSALLDNYDNSNLEVYINDELQDSYPLPSIPQQYDYATFNIPPQFNEQIIDLKFQIDANYFSQTVDLSLYTDPLVLNFYYGYCNIESKYFIDDIEIYYDIISCETDADCGPLEACIDASCVPVECLLDEDCPQGYSCMGYSCIIDLGCETDADCGPLEACIDGVCEILDFCVGFGTQTICESVPECIWDTDRCIANTDYGGYCSVLDQETCNNDPNCYYNAPLEVGFGCLYNENQGCAMYKNESSCMINYGCYWDYYESICYTIMGGRGMGDCYSYNDNELACKSQGFCEYEIISGDCFFAPRCYDYDGDNQACLEIGCKYDDTNQICVMDFSQSDCYQYDITACNENSYCNWDYYSNKCYEDFGNQCSYYDNKKDQCEQQPACIWFADLGICDADFLGGHGSYCWDYDVDQAECEAVGGCSWYTDPFNPSLGWCDPLGAHENCQNGIDDNDNGMCDTNGCIVNGTALPPDPDCSFGIKFQPLGYVVNSPLFGPNLDLNFINITFSDISKVSEAWYSLNKMGETYCDWWLDANCKDGNINLAANSITYFDSTLTGEYELAIFVEDLNKILQPSYIFFFAGDSDSVKPSIDLIYPQNGSTIPYNFTIDFEIEPKGMPKQASYSINGGDDSILPGFFFHSLPVNTNIFPSEGIYTVSVTASNQISTITKNYVFRINDSDEVWRKQGFDYANEIDKLVGNKATIFDNSNFFNEDEFEVIKIMGLNTILNNVKVQINNLTKRLETETNITKINQLKNQITNLKKQTPGEVKIIKSLNDTLQNVQGSYIDSVIRNFQNLTNISIDLAKTQNAMKNLSEIRKQPKKVEIKYLDGTVKNVTKVTEKFVSNKTGKTKTLSYVIHDEIVPNLDLSTATKTIILPDGNALIEINKNLTGKNDLNLCIDNLPVCGSGDISQVNTSVIDITGDIEFIILISDPIVKWNFNAQAPSNTNNGGDANNKGGGGGGSATVTCTESWTCTAWTTCSKTGQQTRTCTDSNNCGSLDNRPEEQRTCNYILPKAEKEDIPTEQSQKLPTQAEQPPVEVEQPGGLQDVTGAVVGAGNGLKIGVAAGLVAVVLGLFVYFHIGKKKF
ncbi:MAG: hypothetical protein ABIC04_01930 [Nanoarchaeota archaeon]